MTVPPIPADANTATRYDNPARRDKAIAVLAAIGVDPYHVTAMAWTDTDVWTTEYIRDLSGVIRMDPDGALVSTTKHYTR